MPKFLYFAQYFSPEKSPRTQFNRETGQFDYFPKNKKRRGITAWASAVRGAYVRSKHGDLLGAK